MAVSIEARWRAHLQCASQPGEYFRTFRETQLNDPGRSFARHRRTVYGDSEHLEEQIKESIAMYEHLYPEAGYKVRITEDQAMITIGDQSWPFAIIGPE